MAGRVINKRLWNLDKEVHSIEIGCVVDAFAGIHTRSFMPSTIKNIENLKRLL